MLQDQNSAVNREQCLHMLEHEHVEVWKFLGFTNEYFINDTVMNWQYDVCVITHAVQ